MMKFTFKTKKDTWIAVVIWLVILLPFYLWIYVDSSTFISLFITGLSSVLLLWIWHGTYYTIDNKLLKYQTGPFYGNIDIMSINKIYNTKSLMSSAALSLDRICIQYEQYNEVFISPERTEEFIRILKKINPNIIVEI